MVVKQQKKSFTKQQSLKNSPAKKISTKIISYARRHKIMAIVVCLTVLLVTLFGIYRINDYRNQFSLENYNSLAITAKSAITSVSSDSVLEKKTCSYESTGVYENPRLFCQVRMVSYVPYTDDAQLLDLAGHFEQAVDHAFPDHSSGFSKVINNPIGYSSSITIQLPRSYPEQSCNFDIASKRFAQVTYDLDRRSESNLIALSFSCSATSRSEYFPVTYRQGH